MVQWETGFVLANREKRSQSGKQMVLTLITKSDCVQCVWRPCVSVLWDSSYRIVKVCACGLEVTETNLERRSEVS